MRILLDSAGLALLAPRQQRESLEGGPKYWCFASRLPHQTTVEVWPDLTLGALANMVVEAGVTYGFGEPGLAWPGCEGRLHRHIQIYEPVEDVPDLTLSQLILTGPRAETDAAAIPMTGPAIDLARWTARRPLERRAINNTGR